MREDSFVFHCAPTLAGIKNGSLFTSDYSEKSDVLSSLRCLNCRLAPKGLRVLPLRYSDKKVLIYVYRPRGLARDLEHSEARMLLSEAGYSASDADKNVIELMRRINETGEFPHEIGLFLSYPPEDVRGFIENGGRDCKCVGTWKVYGDEEAARQTFSRYKQCTNEYCELYRCGRRSLEQLAVSS